MIYLHIFFVDVADEYRDSHSNTLKHQRRLSGKTLDKAAVVVIDDRHHLQSTKEEEFTNYNNMTDSSSR